MTCGATDDELLSRRLVVAGTLSALAAPALAAGSMDVSAHEIALGGRIGLFGLNTATGKIIGHRENERFSMCSTFKVSLCAAVLRRSESGGIDLDQPISIDPAKVLPTSYVTSKLGPNGRLTVEQLCQAAVSYSDNTAANALLDLVGGPEAITAFFRSIGDNVSRLDRTEMALNENLPGDPRDTTSPRAMAGNLSKILVEDRVLSRQSRRKLTDWMSNEQNGRHRIRAGAPRGWRVANKPGTSGNGAVNDIALVWPSSGQPIILAIYSSSPTARLASSEGAISSEAAAALRALGG